MTRRIDYKPNLPVWTERVSFGLDDVQMLEQICPNPDFTRAVARVVELSVTDLKLYAGICTPAESVAILKDYQKALLTFWDKTTKLPQWVSIDLYDCSFDRTRTFYDFEALNRQLSELETIVGLTLRNAPPSKRGRQVSGLSVEVAAQLGRVFARFELPYKSTLAENPAIQCLELVFRSIDGREIDEGALARLITKSKKSPSKKS